MTGEVSGKDLPKVRVVRLDRLNDEGKSLKSSDINSTSSPQRLTEQAVNITFSANAASKTAITRVAQFIGSPLQREVSVAMEQASKNRKEDVDSLAKRVADDVRDDPNSALDAIGLNGNSVEVLKGNSGA